MQSGEKDTKGNCCCFIPYNLRSVINGKSGDQLNGLGLFIFKCFFFRGLKFETAVNGINQNNSWPGPADLKAVKIFLLQSLATLGAATPYIIRRKIFQFLLQAPNLLYSSS